ncbi:MAG: M20/M25/M40 family metallo-hydrolase [Candidatus Velthaea sp.]
MRSVRFATYVLIGALLVAYQPARAQAPPTTATDPVIARIVSRISAQRLRATDERLVAFGTRSTFSENLGRARGVFAARAWIRDQLLEAARRSGGRMTVTYDTYVQKANAGRVPRDVEISSVIATLKGDDPDGRTYIISSHYDSRNSSNEDAVKDAPGADDNGSGTSCVIEAARALADVPVHATVIFATFDSEEQGLFGSAHFAQTLKDAGVNVEGDLNNDIIGASVGMNGESNPNVIRIFSEALPQGADVARINAVGNENDSPSRELARFAKEAGDAYAAPMQANLIWRADRFLRGGDHLSFNARGFPAIRFVEPVENFNHQHQDVRVEGGVQFGDLLQFMDFNYLERASKYNVAALASLALGPGRPKTPVIVTRNLTNDTTLQWSAAPRAASYEVVRRLTTDATWTFASNVGNVTEVTVPFSKDNWLFGIRALDAQGHRGVVAFPSPMR